MRTTRVVSITLPPALFEEAQALAREESRTMSELMREALRRYQRERAWERLRSFGAMSAEMADVKTEEDVVNLVRQVRKEMTEEQAAATEMAVEIHR
jgi:metal-responsive CopG/Arc/MetJ family transcriptional regulator